jgi:diguanylate cyclase (GGDEF)-like protein
MVTVASLSAIQVLELIHPALALLFALSFLTVWIFDRRRVHLVLFFLGLCAYASAIISQILVLPADPGFNAMISAALYVVSTLLIGEGILRRSGLRLGSAIHAGAAVLMLGLVHYLHYVQGGMTGWLGVLDCAVGLVLLSVAMRLWRLAAGPLIDRLLFWVLLCFALHFFPRAFLSVRSAVRGATDAVPWALFDFSMVILGGIMIMTLLATAVVDVIDDIRRDRDTDPLTGLLNRRGFEERATRIASKADQRPVSLILCDIDNFKSVNDTYGHAAGDAVLSELGGILRQITRDGDIAGRIGGEEFAILLPRCDAAGAFRFAERLRTTLMLADFSAIPAVRRVTASLGIAQRHPREPLWDLVSRADAQLYVAKHAGKNCVFVDDSAGRTTAPAEPRVLPKPANGGVLIRFRKPGQSRA